ncbi:EI24 domain-containing protein [Defluviimonas sp. WL0024]|uniref:EI24 domain-containing protein n=1 Tax=Albidovulum salinarum TaxID=2984153 RepID=A0ABT2X781_9RHOB|nr:EI24 domain-containing protein [Defluviimonas sp. WL0024]MCU9849812.1 EI24 domain-containing protein [Defluviimonas sp. WL0024]
MLGDFLKALGQLSDRRFLKVVLLGVALSLALLVAVYAGFAQVVAWLVPDAIWLPFVGEVTWVETLMSWGSLLLMIGLSVFLMVPVASAFTGFFLDTVADAVEDRHYPSLPPAPNVAWMDALIDSVNFFGVLVAVNVLALVLYAFVGPFAPLMFWAVNGYLLGREYFQMAAMRRLGREGARALRKRHSGQIWVAGILMAAPLSLPVVNLVIPVLGAATFTHLFHRLSRER